MVAKKEENSNMEKREKRLADEEKVEDVKAEKLIIFLIFLAIVIYLVLGATFVHLELRAMHNPESLQGKIIYTPHHFDSSSPAGFLGDDSIILTGESTFFSKGYDDFYDKYKNDNGEYLFMAWVLWPIDILYLVIKWGSYGIWLLYEIFF